MPKKTYFNEPGSGISHSYVEDNLGQVFWRYHWSSTDRPGHFGTIRRMADRFIDGPGLGEIPGVIWTNKVLRPPQPDPSEHLPARAGANALEMAIRQVDASKLLIRPTQMGPVCRSSAGD